MNEETKRTETWINPWDLTQSQFEENKTRRLEALCGCIGDAAKIPPSYYASDETHRLDSEAIAICKLIAEVFASQFRPTQMDAPPTP